MTAPPHESPVPRDVERSALLTNVLLFQQFLTALGIPQPVGVALDIVCCLPYIDLGRRQEFKDAFRCLAVRRRDEIAVFDQAFEQFWRTGHPTSLVPDLQVDAEVPSSGVGPGTEHAPTGPCPASLRAVPVFDSQPPQAGGEEESPRRPPSGLYSPYEILRFKDFGAMSHEELRAAFLLLQRFDWARAERRSRRLQGCHDGREIDVRRSLRRGMGHGGELLQLERRGPRTVQRPVIVLCDVSGSMDRYSRVLLHFLHSMRRDRPCTEVFLFATRLTRITPALRHLNPDAALSAVAGDVLDWSGGTRIGESLRTFHRHWARRVMTRRPFVLLISDGWDRGSPDLLAAEMRRLQRMSYRLIWLNPLLGAPAYQPLTTGLRAALPFVDDFLPAHNVAGLTHLAKHLNQMGTTRPRRSTPPAHRR